MKGQQWSVVLLFVAAPMAAGQPAPKPLVTGLKNATAVAVGGDGRIYVTMSGKKGTTGQGSVVVIDNGKPMPFATGFDRPQGIAPFQQWLYVADGQRIWRIDAKGKPSVFVDSAAFPQLPKNLCTITIEPESGTVFVCDFGDMTVSQNALKRSGTAIYKITPRGKVSVLLDDKPRIPQIDPVALLLDGASHLLVSDLKGNIYRIKLADGSIETIADRVGTGLAFDRHGRLIASGIHDGHFVLSVIPTPRANAVALPTRIPESFSMFWDESRWQLLMVDHLAGSIIALPLTVPGWEVDESPLPLKPVVAFPDLKWEGWQPVTDDGKPNQLRTIMLTHAGDGSNRVFVGEQRGTVYVFPNDPKAAEAKIFLDIRDRVSYSDNQNEEGFLGLAFHPKFKTNGEFFVYYTLKKPKLTNVLSRFRVRKDDPTKADPASEEELMRFTKPFWNHDGGTLAFGPDGYLYLAHGDGGAGADPYDNGQNLNSFLGKVHRIDVDRKDPGKNYAIPRDNPFVGRADAKPEIWAYGLRNIWRMAFDRETGKLWAADVGQNLFEEIDIITRGGNYGWNRREGLHPFGAKGTGPRKEYIDPIWEYHHDLGKSITGGAVYRGKRLPELNGYYLYGDYVSCKLWALRFDEAKGRVVANRPIPDLKIPIYSFGEDAAGEVYFLTATNDGRGIYRFERGH